ncbi:FAD-binding oxidoreductase [Joostella atrarenae]|uniref:FAD-binding oxidoreductase n=1 Tax=Joostella atrarenae TaxID=679257 RepID=A0ABS9J4Q2_9FLAO|nr:FAD-dependent oxidoreductase [Joostella atrarenae]MCF8715416.1 FAD-binding oxidoreductase [Joostella atrarenae]
MIDYIVVGIGLGGIAFCEQLEKNNKDFIVFDDDSQQSSNVAGGMYNPVTLKRFTSVWRSEEQLKMLTPFYKALENKLSVKVDHKIPVYRRFVSIEEQNMWFEASDKPGLQPFLSTKLIKNDNPSVDAPLGFGEVLHTGRVHTDLLQVSYTKYLDDKGRLKKEHFDYHALEINKASVNYKGIEAKHIVFCEGFGLNRNPYFNYLPLVGTKGELLEIECDELELDFILKSGVFIIPLGGKRFKIGATNKWKDKTNTPTEASRNELEEKLQNFLKCDYKVVDHIAGVRPTVVDRRPLIGNHPKHTPLYILNGLGSRGVMIAPYVSERLFEAIENNIPLEKEIDIVRYKKKYPTKYVGKTDA